MEFTINSTISVETTPTGVAVLSLNRPEQWKHAISARHQLINSPMIREHNRT
jgi:hypothetical protein